jgi:hypothetical protein
MSRSRLTTAPDGATEKCEWLTDVFTADLYRKIDSVCPNASGRLDRIDELPDSAGKAIVNTLLRQACESQHIGNITSARRALLMLPRAWLSSVLQGAIAETIDLADEWEYRRLVELLKELNAELFESYIEYGIAVGSGAIFEAASDIKSG